MDVPRDEEVWNRILDGDPRSFGTIWDRHHDRVFRALISSGSMASDAEDLSAVTFLELWRRRDAVRFVDGSLLPWLLVTAHNVGRNAARSARRYRGLLARIPAPEPPPDPAETVDSPSPRVLAVREILASARAVDRALIALTALDGLTVREAAMAVGLGESAAKMRLSRLRRRMREGAGAHDAIDSAPALEGDLR